MNASLVSGLNSPVGIAVSGSNLFVTNVDNGTIGEYTTSGAVVNASLVSGLSSPYGIAVSGSNLFVVNQRRQHGTIGEYTTSGAVVNASLVSGLSSPIGIAVSGSNLFVTNSDSGTIGEYTTSGATVNASLVSGLNGPFGIAITPAARQWHWKMGPAAVGQSAVTGRVAMCRAFGRHGHLRHAGHERHLRDRYVGHQPAAQCDDL